MGGWLPLFRLCKHYSVNVNSSFLHNALFKAGQGAEDWTWTWTWTQTNPVVGRDAEFHCRWFLFCDVIAGSIQQKPLTHKLFKTELGLLGTTVSKVKIRVSRVRFRVSRVRFRVLFRVSRIRVKISVSGVKIRVSMVRVKNRNLSMQFEGVLFGPTSRAVLVFKSCASFLRWV